MLHLGQGRCSRLTVISRGLRHNLFLGGFCSMHPVVPLVTSVAIPNQEWNATQKPVSLGILMCTCSSILHLIAVNMYHMTMAYCRAPQTALLRCLCRITVSDRNATLVRVSDIAIFAAMVGVSSTINYELVKVAQHVNQKYEIIEVLALHLLDMSR